LANDVAQTKCSLFVVRVLRETTTGLTVGASSVFACKLLQVAIGNLLLVHHQTLRREVRLRSTAISGYEPKPGLGHDWFA
jgi:hypothetical protein